MIHVYAAGSAYAVTLPVAPDGARRSTISITRWSSGSCSATRSGSHPDDKRITYVGGDYGADWLAGEVDAGRADLAILIAPVTVDDFVAVNLTREKLPRKSTWFTPKARAGLVVVEAGAGATRYRVGGMRVYVGSDHAGFELKDHLVTELGKQGHDVVDIGPTAYDPEDDYPAYCLATGAAVVAEPGSLGVVIGGSGNGEQIAANKVPGVRAALAWNDRDRDAVPPAQRRERGRHRRADAHARRGDRDRDRVRVHAVLRRVPAPATDRRGRRVRAVARPAGVARVARSMRAGLGAPSRGARSSGSPRPRPGRLRSGGPRPGPASPHAR